MNASGRYVHYAGTILVVTLLMLSGAAWGVGLHEEDVYDWGNPPSDLPRPSSALIGKVHLSNGGIVGSCVVVQPNWVMTVQHVHPDWPGRYIVIEGQRYDIVDTCNVSGLTLVKIEYPDQTPANMEEFIGFGNPVLGAVVTAGGFGDTFDYSHSPPLENGAGTLRWGRNTLSRYTATEVVAFVFNEYEEADYVRYECVNLDHDSGSGWFFRGPYGWRLVGCVGAPEAAINMGYCAQSVIDAINEYPGEEYVEPYSPPAPDTSWTGQSGGSWLAPGNWSNGVPDLDKVALLDGATANLSSGDAYARELHIGRDDCGELQQLDGTLNVGDMIAVGGSGGVLAMEGGTLSVPTAYIGLGGSCAVVQGGGTVNIAEDLYLGAWTGSGSADYELAGSNAVLNAERILFGAESGCGGLMIVDSSTEVHARRMIIGLVGDGTLRLTGGAATIDDMEMAFGPDTNGSCQVYEGSLCVGSLTAGRGEGAVGTIEVSGGAVSIADLNNPANVNLAGYYPPMMGQYSVNQTDGAVAVERVKIGADDSYKLGGGTLTVTDWAEIAGALDFDNGSGTLACEATVNLQNAEILDAGNATLGIAEEVLVILPEGFDLENDLGALVNDGLCHIAGNELVILDGEGFVGSMVTVSDPVEVQGTGYILATEGGIISLVGGLSVGPDGSIDLGNGRLVVNEVSTINDPVSCRLYRVVIGPGAILEANGTMSVTSQFRYGGTLDIGPGVTSLMIHDLSIWGIQASSGGRIRMDVGGLGQGEADYLTVESEGMEVFMLVGQGLEVRFVDGFVPAPGQQIDLISFPAGRRVGEFLSVTHNGPAWLRADAVYDDQNGKIGVVFSRWTRGDLNCDGFVGQGDLNIVLGQWGRSGEQITDPRADATGDSFVGQGDLDIVLADWGKSLGQGNGMMVGGEGMFAEEAFAGELEGLDSLGQISLEISQVDGNEVIPGSTVYVTNVLTITTDSDWISGQIVVSPTGVSSPIYNPRSGAYAPYFCEINGYTDEEGEWVSGHPYYAYDSFVTAGMRTGLDPYYPEEPCYVGAGSCLNAADLVGSGGSAVWSNSAVDQAWWTMYDDEEGERVVAQITLKDTAQGTWSFRATACPADGPAVLATGTIVDGVMVPDE